MWTIVKKFRFEASHQLPHHDGKCKRLHGHSWVMRVSVSTRGLIEQGPQRGMVLDFGVLKSIVKPLIDDYLDHHHLNETLPIANPTSEEVACWAYFQIYPRVHALGFTDSFALAVTVEETCTSECTFTNDSHLLQFTKQLKEEK